MEGATINTSSVNAIEDASGTSFNIGITEVFYIATDLSGNQDSCSFLIEILDLAAPVITPPADNEIAECDGSGNTLAFQTWLDSNGGATATDACNGVSWSTNPADPQISDGCGQTGSVTVEFIAMDAAGNTASTSASFTIEG